MTEETYAHAGFDDFEVGDRMKFCTSDNGFGSTGGLIWRTGTVTKISAVTITVSCDPNRIGPRALIRRSPPAYEDRSPMRAPGAQQ